MIFFGIYGYIFIKEMIFDLGILIFCFNNFYEIKKEKCNGEFYIFIGFFIFNLSVNKNFF